MLWDWFLYTILANPSIGRAFTRYTRRSSSPTSSWNIIAILIGVALIWLAIYYWDKIKKSITPDQNTPKVLFLELARAHKLNRSERDLLYKLALANYQENPACVFVDPGLFRKLAEAGGGQAATYQALAQKIFVKSAD